jgi:hypothetical protein
MSKAYFINVKGVRRQILWFTQTLPNQLRNTGTSPSCILHGAARPLISTNVGHSVITRKRSVIHTRRPRGFAHCHICCHGNRSFKFSLSVATKAIPSSFGLYYQLRKHSLRQTTVMHGYASTICPPAFTDSHLFSLRTD